MKWFIGSALVACVIMIIVLVQNVLIEPQEPDTKILDTYRSLDKSLGQCLETYREEDRLHRVCEHSQLLMQLVGTYDADVFARHYIQSEELQQLFHSVNEKVDEMRALREERT